MRPDLILFLVYITGAYLTFRFAKQIVSEDPKYVTNPGAAWISASFVALLWPVAVPLHVVGVLRRKAGMLTEFEKKRIDD